MACYDFREKTRLDDGIPTTFSVGRFYLKLCYKSNKPHFLCVYKSGCSYRTSYSLGKGPVIWIQGKEKTREEK